MKETTMKMFLYSTALIPAVTLLAMGCGQPVTTPSTVTQTKATTSTIPTKVEETPKGGHSGYWCKEHGMPEAVCDLCDEDYRDAEKAKGNWCEHKRVKSSCFQCNPGLKEKFAADYKAKTGKVAPPTDDEKKK